MNWTKPIASVSVALVLAASTASTQSVASSSDRPTLSQSLQGQSKQEYESGRLLAASGDFAGAVDKFWRAYEISKEPRLLYNVAVCEKDLRHYARARSLLQQYMHDAGPLLSPEERAMIQDALMAMQSLVATLHLTVTEEDAAVLIDARPGGTTPLVEPLELDVGKHLVTVQKPGFVRVDLAIDATGGAESKMTVTLRALPGVTAPLAGITEGPTADSGAELGATAALGAQRSWALGLGALGVAGVGFGTAFGVVSLSKHNEAASSCVNRENPCTPAGVDAGRAAQMAGDVSTVAFIVGAVALAGGVALWVSAPKKRQSAVALQPGLARLGVGPALTGVWW